LHGLRLPSLDRSPASYKERAAIRKKTEGQSSVAGMLPKNAPRADASSQPIPAQWILGKVVWLAKKISAAGRHARTERQCRG